MAKKTKKEKKEVLTKGRAKSEKQALTMEDLLKLEEAGQLGFKKGEEVKGKITAIKNKSIYIDVGGKTDAVVSGKEFEFVKDYVADLKLGDEIEVQIKTPENDRGQILASIRGAASGYGWNYFSEKEKSGGEVTVFAKELNRGGAVVIAPFGFFGFIPGSQIGSKYDGDPDKLISKKVKVKVLEVDQAKNRLVFSERLVSEPDKVGEEVGAIENLNVDDVFEAEIVRVEPFGIFVKVAYDNNGAALDLEGLVHISEISWEKVSDLSQIFKVKDKIKIKLISKDEGRLQFSIKRLTDDPWEKIEKKYPKDKEFEGEVVRIAGFGVLVKLEIGVEGLIHISKLGGGVNLKEGEKVMVYIESIDVERRKISLGLVETDKKNIIYK
ncbi:MAG: S1 RNA-binding domain-containing protein [Bacteriovorax sp.]|nr:S1 RNA-binding domain-containing protein [Bacteriovorax sp.]